jgi:hypothetical protein
MAYSWLPPMRSPDVSIAAFWQLMVKNRAKDAERRYSERIGYGMSFRKREKDKDNRRKIIDSWFEWVGDKRNSSVYETQGDLDCMFCYGYVVGITIKHDDDCLYKMTKDYLDSF